MLILLKPPLIHSVGQSVNTIDLLVQLAINEDYNVGCHGNCNKHSSKVSKRFIESTKSIIKSSFKSNSNNEG